MKKIRASDSTKSLTPTPELLLPVKPLIDNQDRQYPLNFTQVGSSPEEQREYQRIKNNAKSPTKNKESKQQKEFIDAIEEAEMEELMKKMLSDLRKDIKEDMTEIKNKRN